MKTIVLLLVFIFCSSAFAIEKAASPAAAPILLGTNVLQKKSEQANAPVQGGSVDHVKCILESMQVKYQIRSLPWKRARQEVHSSVLDGFFTAVSIDDASDFATFSAPLVLENWYWFWRADMVAPASWKQHFQIGVILGSQQEAILSNEGYSDFVTANNLEQLTKLLFSKRIDALLLDKDVFEKIAEKMKISSRDYKSRFFRYMPLGIYFGERFLRQHPDFLTAFNSRIHGCTAIGFELSSDEKEKVRTIVSPWIQKIVTDRDIIAAVVKQNSENRTKTDNQLLKIDEQWQLAFKVNNQHFPRSLVNADVSALLIKIAVNSKDLLSEIILIDDRGYNVAISNMTSDYWQGDEEKFTQVFNKSAATIYFDKIKYDASSRRFQIQLSVPLRHPQTQKSIGTLTLGVDIDKALSLAN